MNKTQDRYINLSESTYTISEAERLTNVDRDKIRIMINHGQIQTVRMPGGWMRIPGSEMQKIKGLVI
jgi:excisionase family DNA binding protein